MIAALLSQTRDESLRSMPALPRAQRPRTSRALTSVRRTLLIALVPLVLSLGLVAPASVLGATTVAVSVAIHAPPVATIGSEVILTASVQRADHIAPTGMRVALYIDGAYLSSSHADVAGNLDFRLSGAATGTAGTFSLEARFDGARGLSPGRASATLKIRPAQVKVATVPAVSGIPISVGDGNATTGADGTATVNVSQVGSASLEAHLDLVSDQSIRVSFTRWGDQVYDLKRTISVRGDATYVLGLRTAYRAAVHFVDVSGAPVDATAISRARFTSSSGGELVLTSFDNVWWEAGTAVSRTGGLQPSATLWRLTEVEMAGTNVVNQGQQDFSPTIDGAWTINLLLYDLVVRTEDALTGSALPGTAELVFPDSTSKTLTLGADGSARFNALPRGSYLVKLKTAGITPPTPIALSRSQDATIRAISYVDIGAGVGLALVVLFALLWIGRRRQMPWLMRATAAPLVLARRLPLESASAAVRRRVPSARSAVAHVAADVVSIGSERGSAALAFGRLLLVQLARALVRVVEVGARLLAAVARGIEHAVHLLIPASRRIASSVASARDRRAEAAAARAGEDGERARPSRTPAGATAPSWPTPTGGEALPVAHPPAPAYAARPSPQPAQRASEPSARSRGWFEALPEDEGPTHECVRCHRQVPDSARFCRSCGHLQA